MNEKPNEFACTSQALKSLHWIEQMGLQNKSIDFMGCVYVFILAGKSCCAVPENISVFGKTCVESVFLGCLIQFSVTWNIWLTLKVAQLDGMLALCM